MLNYSIIYSNNRDVKFTFFTDYSFSKEYLEALFLNYSSCVLPLAEFQAKNTMFLPFSCQDYECKMFYVSLEPVTT